MIHNILKPKLICQTGNSSNERNTLSLTHNSPDNKTLFNSTNTSRLSTKFNSSESLLFNSFYNNNNILNFQMKNIRLKNKIFSSTIKDINNNSYQNFMKSKIYNNKSKLKLPIMDIKKEYVSPSPKLKRISTNNDNDNDNYNYTKIKSYSNNKDTKKESFIELKLRDELLDIFNFKSNRLG